MSKVFILGAGASAGYENSERGPRAPVAKEFISTAVKLVGDGRIPRCRFTNLFRFLKDYYSQDEHALRETHLDIEEVLTILDLNIRSGRTQFANPRKELIELIYLTLNTALYGNMCQHHSALLGQCSSGDTIITFNWDLLVDNLMSMPEGRPDYGLSFTMFHTERGWAESVNIGQDKPKLLKLHGSLNWMYCPSMPCHTNYAYILNGKTAAEQILKPDDRLFLCPKCGRQTLQPVIIPPTLNKPFGRWHAFDILWREAAKALKNADEIIIIGYSLPVTDFRAKWLFLESVTNRLRPLNKLTVVDKCPKDLFEKYKQIFRVPPNKFEGIAGEIKDLRCNTPND